ncbi:MAG: hypothetical protein JO317_03135 [Verrucomicrobiae bacterium]|nr:hypothetical protein [Verrucomicrobiae bacterium]
MGRASSRRGGFILMEILLAGVILGLALVAMNIAVARCVHALNVSENYTKAARILRQRSLFFDTGNETARVGFWEGTEEVEGRPFHWRQELTGTDDPHLLRESIRVEWKQADGKRDETWEGYRWVE